MAIFDVFKKKKAKELDLPPPPDSDSPELPPLPDQDIPPISAKPEKQAQLSPSEHLPEVPQPVPTQEPKPPHDITPPTPEPIHKAPIHEEPKPKVQHEHKEFMIEEPHVEGPLFVNVADYQEILQGVDKIKTTLSDSEEIISKLNDLKNAEDKVFENWRSSIEDIERKITYIDQVIFRGE